MTFVAFCHVDSRIRIGGLLVCLSSERERQLAGDELSLCGEMLVSRVH